MYSESPTCEKCGMAFANMDELASHHRDVHAEGMFQCQSGGRVFEEEQEFSAHVGAAHSQSNLDLGKEQMFEEIQSELLRRSDEDEKARKRSRGPYRKSAAA